MIMSGNYSPMTGARWDAVTKDAKDVIEKLLLVDATERLSAKDILKHKWFQGDKEAGSADDGRGQE